MNRQSTAQAKLTEKIDSNGKNPKRTSTQRFGKIKEASFAEDEEDAISKEYGSNPLQTPPSKQTRSQNLAEKDSTLSQKSQGGLTRYQKDLKEKTSPAKRITIDPVDEAENEFRGNREKMNRDLNHLNHTHYDDHTMNARKKAKGHGIDDNPDRLEQLKDQNTQLKTKQRDLEQQVKLISTKLQRQISIINSERFAGKNRITAQFERDLDDLERVNSELKDEERLLMDKVKKLQAKRKKELSEGKNLYSVATQGGDEKRRINKYEHEQRQVIESLRVTLEKSNKELLSLAKQQEDFKRMQGSDVNIDMLRQQKIEVEHKMAQARSRLEDIKANLKVRDEIFNSGKSYETSLLDNLREIERERASLEQTKRTLQSSAETNVLIKEKIDQTRTDRDRLQGEFDNIMRKPFFKREQDQGNLQQLDALQAKIDNFKNQYEEDKRKIITHEQEKKKLEADSGKLQEEIGFFKDQVQRMKANLDPTSLTIGDIMKKLKKEDEARFREVMEDLSYEGKDPNWHNQGISDQLNQIKGFEAEKKDDQKSLIEMKEKLQQQKVQLVNELVRTQGLLQTTVEIDKQQASLYQTELTQLQQKIKAAYNSSNELTTQIRDKSKKLLTLQEHFVPQGLTSKDLEKFNQQISLLKKESKDAQDDDNMTEFSTFTDETEIGPIENLLDLRISTCSFERGQLSTLLQGQNFSYEKIQTFLAVDFYNHDTKTTDLAMTDAPVYNTLFSFKNTVDDFYLRHLQTDTILVDVFACPFEKERKTVKIGYARLPLNKLIEKDNSFQAQEIIHEAANGAKIKIGRIFYRMRMRKDLSEAQRWQRERASVVAIRDPTANSLAPKSIGDLRLVEIIVKQAQNLSIRGQPNNQRMMPFFNYQFYTFPAVTSQIATGTNPTFDHRKQFEVEETSEFIEFMRRQKLQIDFMDDSSDVTLKNVRDYIGSVRISLADVLSSKNFAQNLQIRDENNSEQGKVQISIRILNPAEYDHSNLQGDHLRLTDARKTQQDVIEKIVHKFAESNFDDIDLLLNLLFTRYPTTRPGQVQSVTRGQFKEFLLDELKVRNLNEQDIDIFIKTNIKLKEHQIFTRELLKSVLEDPFAKVREHRFEIEANSTTRYGTQHIQNAATQVRNVQNTFGHNLSPVKATNAGWLTNNKLDASESGDLDRDLGQTFTRRDETMFSPKQKTVQVDNMYAKQNFVHSDTQIGEYMKENVYKVIQEYQSVVGGALIVEAQEYHTREVLKKFFPGITDEQCDAFHKSHQAGMKEFYYREALLHKYQARQAHGIGAHEKRQTPEQKESLQKIRIKLYSHMQKMNYSLEDLYSHINKTNASDLTSVQFADGFKGLLTEHEAVELYNAADYNRSGSVDFKEFLHVLIQIRVALALEAIEKAMDMQTGPGDAAKKFFQDDKDKSGTLDVIEFGRTLEAAWKKVPKDELDDIFRTLCKNNKESLTEEDLRNAFKNKEQSLISIPIVGFNDMLLPLFTKAIKRMRVQPAKIWETFNRSGKIGSEELSSMLGFYLQIKLIPEEEALLKSFLRQKSSTGAFNEAQFADFWKEANFKRAQNQPSELVVQNAMLKLGASLQKQGKSLQTEVSNFQSWNEKENGEIMLRNFKYFLSFVANLSQNQLDACVNYFDTNGEGFVKIADIQKKYPSEIDIKNYKTK